MALVSSSVHLVEGAVRNNTNQRLILTVTSSRLLLFQMTLEDQEVGLMDSSQITLSALVPKACVRFCVHPLSEVSVSLSLLGLSKVSLFAVKGKHSGTTHLPNARTPN